MARPFYEPLALALHPTPGGLPTYSRQMRRGAPKESILEQLSHSPEPVQYLEKNLVGLQSETTQLRTQIADFESHLAWDPAIAKYESNYNTRSERYRDATAGGERLSYGSCELELGRLWSSLDCLLKPRRILETETCAGYSTCCRAPSSNSQRLIRQRHHNRTR